MRKLRTLLSLFLAVLMLSDGFITSYASATSVSSGDAVVEKSTEASVGSTDALDKLMNSNTPAKEPVQEIKEDKQGYGEAVVDEMVDTSIGKGTETAIRETMNKIEKAVADEAAHKLSESKRLAEKGARKLAEAEKVSPGKAKRLIRKGENCLNNSDTLKEAGKKFEFASNTLKVISVAADGFNIYNNIMDMGDLSNERSSMKVLEFTMLGVDTAFAVVSIAATLGASISPPGLVISLAVGITSAVLHSDAFADWANNAESGFLDALDSIVEALLPWMKTPDGVGCYKPNIYLYTDEKKRVTVEFVYPQLLTVTIPDYRTGWEVTAQGDGLYDEATGEEYEYLFYESMTSRNLFQTESGWLVPAGEREEAFREILTDMGFNEQEIDDFVEFWVTKLEENVDYIMYPQDTATVNMAMPIRIDPVPESLERIWFVFWDDCDRDVEEPQNRTIMRDENYAAVEWGGMIF